MPAKLLHLFLTLCDFMECNPPGSSLSMEFSRQEYKSELSCPVSEDLPNPGTEPMSLISPALAGGSLSLALLRSPLRGLA